MTDRTTRRTWTHSAGSSRAVPGFSGYAGAASYLNSLYGVQISRQLVSNWYVRRGSTKFPEKKTVESEGHTLELFDLDEVAAWYARRVGKEPLG